MPVAAGIVGEASGAAVIALLDMPAKCRRPARRDRAHDPSLAAAETPAPGSCRSGVHPIEKAQRADDLVERRPGYPLRDQMHLVGADVLQPETIGGTPEILAEPRDGVDVGLLGRRRKIVDRHVSDHATTRRPDLDHLETSCLGVGCNAQILSDSGPITRHRPTRRNSGFVPIPRVSLHQRGSVGPFWVKSGQLKDSDPLSSATRPKPRSGCLMCSSL